MKKSGEVGVKVVARSSSNGDCKISGRPLHQSLSSNSASRSAGTVTASRGFHLHNHPSNTSACCLLLAACSASYRRPRKGRIHTGYTSPFQVPLKHRYYCCTSSSSPPLLRHSSTTTIPYLHVPPCIRHGVACQWQVQPS
jgi:hypothetical protein